MPKLDEKTYYFDYKGKRILIKDYSGMKQEQLIDRIEYNRDLVVTLGKDQLILVDVTDCIGTPAVISAFKQSASTIRHCVKKIAIIGLTGIQNVLLQGVTRFSSLAIKPFSSRESAIDWLAE